MRYLELYPNVNLITEIMERKKFRMMETTRAVFGNSHHTIRQRLVESPNWSSESLVKLCNVLDVSLDDIYAKQDSVAETETPIITGNHNIVNSSNVNIDMLQLRAENRVLKLLVNEKEERIKELKKVNDDIGKRLDLALENALNRDKNG